MNELFLYYLWEQRLLYGDLFTTKGESIDIIKTGYRNTDSGPDFREARIRIGITEWVGDVEIHVRTSDWNRHRHQEDRAYNSVVLHVVYWHDLDVNDIPVLELKGHYDQALFGCYQKFMGSRGWIPCERSVMQVHQLTWSCWFDRLVVERLEHKIQPIITMLEGNHYDWEDTAYRLIMRYFGMKVNREAFDSLSKILPLKILLKHADNLLQVEAMLFGCSGLLDGEFQDDYPKLLQREFRVMKAKFGLVSLPKEYWHYLRMRPSNFPTIRLAQMAMLIHRNRGMFSKIIHAKNIYEMERLFEVQTSEYWEGHYRFDVKTQKKPRHVGTSTVEILVINAIVPLLFCYGKLHKDNELCETALNLLENIHAEDNHIVRRYCDMGLKPSNALQSQAILQLYSTYCKRRRCLDCMAGVTLINGGRETD